MRVPVSNIVSYSILRFNQRVVRFVETNDRAESTTRFIVGVHISYFLSI